jgi:hypothetical protein
MPSTPFAYPQVISRHLASFRVVKPHLSAAQADFWAGFDSRQPYLVLAEGEANASATRPRIFSFRRLAQTPASTRRSPSSQLTIRGSARHLAHHEGLDESAR